ncbi:calcium-binding protein [Trichothermofontia sp.]
MAFTITGTPGNDRILGTIDSDRILLLEGHDTAYGGDGNDSISGDLGNDLIFGGRGDDVINGGHGEDFVFGGKGSDTVYGDEGNDFIRGDLDNDFLYGGAGNDYIYGGKGDDNLYGGDGNDILFGDRGNDVLTGGTGSDIFVIGPDTDADVITDFQNGVDVIGLIGGLNYENLDIYQEGVNTILRNRTTQAVIATLQGVNASLLSPSDFTTVIPDPPTPPESVTGTSTNSVPNAGVIEFEGAVFSSIEGNPSAPGFPGEGPPYPLTMASVTVTRRESFVGDVSVTVYPQTGTSPNAALAGVDFIAQPIVFTWQDGQGGPLTRSFPIIADNIFESPSVGEIFNEDGDVGIIIAQNGNIGENVLLTMGPPTGGAVLGPQREARLIILDDDADLNNGLGNLIQGTNGDDVLTGTARDDTLIGFAGSDIIDGGAGSDLIIGGLGSDILTGGRPQTDYFQYNSPNEGTDVITDFGRLVFDAVINQAVQQADKFRISAAGFGLSPVDPVRVINVPSTVVVGPAPSSSGPTFIFNPSESEESFNGTTFAPRLLTFDPDGTVGPAQPIPLAFLPSFSIAITDIIVTDGGTGPDQVQQILIDVNGSAVELTPADFIVF